MKGTPKTMIGAIVNGLDILLEKENQISVAMHVEKQVRDYLSQKFTVTLLRCDEEQEKLVNKLWLEITGEEIKK